MRIALYQGKSAISRLIRWQTRSQYSHAAFLLDDGSVIEAWQPCVREITPPRHSCEERGIYAASALSTKDASDISRALARITVKRPEGRAPSGPRTSTFNPQPLPALSRQHTAGTTVDIFKFIVPLTADENRQLEFLARRDVGTPYDYRGIIRFLTRQRDGRSRRLFCSEQVFARCQQIGRPLLDRTEAWRVPPDWLARSPRLELDQTIVTV